MQARVKLESHNKVDYSITLIVGQNRIEFFLGDAYHRSVQDVRQWLTAGWCNHIVAKLFERCNSVVVGNANTHETKYYRREDLPPWLKEVKEQNMSLDSNALPSKEYSWTVIATTAKSVTYQGNRLWFKTLEDAKAFAASIFEGEDRQKQFDLAIVQCQDVVAKKPTIEVISRW